LAFAAHGLGEGLREEQEREEEHREVLFQTRIAWQLSGIFLWPNVEARSQTGVKVEEDWRNHGLRNSAQSTAGFCAVSIFEHSVTQSFKKWITVEHKYSSDVTR
jgi:hypothetical protein